jgi:phosphoribosylformimino-5-aminoimidazole carboxamide ribonucleotide (ProFAR) isomerase
LRSAHEKRQLPPATAFLVSQMRLEGLLRGLNLKLIHNLANACNAPNVGMGDLAMVKGRHPAS